MITRCVPNTVAKVHGVRGVPGVHRSVIVPGVPGVRRSVVVHGMADFVVACIGMFVVYDVMSTLIGAMNRNSVQVHEPIIEDDVENEAERNMRDRRQKIIESITYDLEKIEGQINSYRKPDDLE